MRVVSVSPLVADGTKGMQYRAYGSCVMTRHAILTWKHAKELSACVPVRDFQSFVIPYDGAVDRVVVVNSSEPSTSSTMVVHEDGVVDQVFRLSPAFELFVHLLDLPVLSSLGGVFPVDWLHVRVLELRWVPVAFQKRNLRQIGIGWMFLYLETAPPLPRGPDAFPFFCGIT